MKEAKKEISPRTGKASWVLKWDDYDENKKRIQKEKHFKTKREAEEFRIKTEHDKKTGTYTSNDKGYTVRTWLDAWIDTYKVGIVRDNTVAGYRNNINHIKARIGNVPLEKLTTDQIQKALNDLMNSTYIKESKKGKITAKLPKHYSAKTVRSCHAILFEALKRATKNRLIPFNPAEDVELPKVEQKEHYIMTDEEMNRLMEALKETECGPVITVCATLGLRRGEALGLQWDDIDFKQRVIHVRHNYKIIHTDPGQPEKLELSELKTKKSKRDLPMDEDLAQMFTELKQGKKEAAAASDGYILSNFVFTTIEGKPFRPDSISQAFKRAAIRAGVKDVHLHDLRHNAVTYWINNGTDMRTVSEMAGHSSVAFTMDTYAHPIEESKKKAVDLISKRVFAYRTAKEEQAK